MNERDSKVHALIILLLLVLSGCGPNPDKARATSDTRRLYPNARIVSIVVGEGNDEYVEWDITVIDSIGQRRRTSFSYAYDKPGGWRLLTAA